MNTNKACIIPTMRYKNAKKAISWLCNAFGFETHLVVEGDNDTIAHAQLVYGNSMIMLSSEKDNEYDKLLKTPLNLNGINTQSAYIFVDKVDDHYRQAINAGAIILIEIKDEDYGGRVYTCKDSEGYVWSFGSYNPWAESAL